MIANANKPGLLVLADSVRTYFEAQRYPFVVGETSRRSRWRAYSERPEGAGRVLFVPAWEDGGVLGNIERKGRRANPDELLAIDYRFRLFCWAQFPGSDKWADHYTAAEALFELTWAALRRAAVNASNLDQRDAAIAPGQPLSSQYGVAPPGRPQLQTGSPISLFTLVKPGELREFDDNTDDFQGVELQCKCTLDVSYFDRTYDVGFPGLKLNPPSSLNSPIPDSQGME